MLNVSLLQILVCPLCKKDLIYNKTNKELICIKDSLAYPIENDIPIMLKERARKVSSSEIEEK